MSLLASRRLSQRADDCGRDPRRLASFDGNCGTGSLTAEVAAAAVAVDRQTLTAGRRSRKRRRWRITSWRPGLAGRVKKVLSKW